MSRTIRRIGACLLLVACGCGSPNGTGGGRDGSADAAPAVADGAVSPRDGTPAARDAVPVADAVAPPADAAHAVDAVAPPVDAAHVADAVAPLADAAPGADAGPAGRLHLLRFGLHWVGFAGADRRYRAAGDGAERVDFAGGGLHVRGELR